MEKCLKISLLQLLDHARTLLDGMAAALNRADLPLPEIGRLISGASQAMPAWEKLLDDFRSVAGEDQPPAGVISNGNVSEHMPEQEPKKKTPDREPKMPTPLVQKVEESSSSSEEEDDDEDYEPPLTKKARNSQVESSCASEKGFKCIHCSKILNQKTSLDNHILSKHTNIRPFVCSFEGCGKLFAIEHAMLRHYNAHVGQFLCVKCKQKFSRQDYLLRHVREKHNKQRS